MTEFTSETNEANVARNRELLNSSEMSWALNDVYTRVLDLHPELSDVEIFPIPADSGHVGYALPSWESGKPHHQELSVPEI